METISSNMEKISRALDKHNETMIKIMEAMPKQDNFFMRGLALGGGIAGVLGMFDIIIKWLWGLN